MFTKVRFTKCKTEDIEWQHKTMVISTEILQHFGTTWTFHYINLLQKLKKKMIKLIIGKSTDNRVIFQKQKHRLL